MDAWQCLVLSLLSVHTPLQASYSPVFSKILIQAPLDSGDSCSHPHQKVLTQLFYRNACLFYWPPLRRLLFCASSLILVHPWNSDLGMKRPANINVRFPKIRINRIALYILPKFFLQCFKGHIQCFRHDSDIGLPLVENLEGLQ